MRILYLQPAEGFGGAERQSISAIKHLPEEGIDVVPVIGPGHTIVRALEEAGVYDYIHSTELPLRVEGPGTLLERLRRNTDLVTAWHRTSRRLAHIIAKRRIDLVFASRAFGWAVTTAVSRADGTSIVWRAGSRLTTPRQRRVIRAVGVLRPPDALVSNCDAVQASIAPLLDCSAFVVPNGVALERFDPETARPDLRRDIGLSDVPTIGVPARPAPDKGFDLLPAVIRKTVEKAPSAHVLIAGDYPWRSRYEALFTAAGLGDRVTFLGHVHDMAGFYMSCDVVLLTSRAHSIEGSPNALLEAMAMKRPVVATRVGGIGEAVTHGREGYLTEPDDADGLAHYTAALLASPLLRIKLGGAGRKTIVSRYSERISAARLAEALRAVATRSALPFPKPVPKERCHNGIA